MLGSPSFIGRTVSAFQVDDGLENDSRNHSGTDVSQAEARVVGHYVTATFLRFNMVHSV
jgi:hypothetical protein